MKYYLIAFILITIVLNVDAQEDDKIFTIYLVRHAEKEILAAGNKDPSLTRCGQQRAASLAGFFTDVGLEAVYSTDYIRTKDTAQPTATAKGVEVNLYNPGELNRLAELLIDQKQDALVVGHSNTTGQLAGILIGEQLGSFDESIYNRIYQVVICNEQRRLHLLASSFVCIE